MTLDADHAIADDAVRRVMGLFPRRVGGDT